MILNEVHVSRFVRFSDDTPHIYNDTILNTEVVTQIILNETDIIMQVFPETSVYAALGNHDWSPKHQLPPHCDHHCLYDTLADAWTPWLDSASQESFKGGASAVCHVRLRGLIWTYN